MPWTREMLDRKTDLAVALLDRAVEEGGADAFRHVRVTQLLRDHLDLVTQDQACGILAELRRRRA